MNSLTGRLKLWLKRHPRLKAIAVSLHDSAIYLFRRLTTTLKSRTIYLLRRISRFLAALQQAPSSDSQVPATLAAHYERAMVSLGRTALWHLVRDFHASGVLEAQEYALLRAPSIACELDAAKSEIQLAIEASPDCAEAHYWLGFILREQGQNMSAVAEFLLATSERLYFPKYEYDLPVASRAYHEAGVLLEEAGNVFQAEYCQQRALAIDSANTGAHAAYARLLASRGQAGAAAHHFRLSIAARITAAVLPPIALDGAVNAQPVTRSD